MSERLKGSVSFEVLVPTGPYRNARASFSQEFYLDEHNHEEILENLAGRLREELSKILTTKELAQ